jgi:hypothetical protein
MVGANLERCLVLLDVDLPGLDLLGAAAAHRPHQAHVEEHRIQRALFLELEPKRQAAHGAPGKMPASGLSPQASNARRQTPDARRQTPDSQKALVFIAPGFSNWCSERVVVGPEVEDGPREVERPAACARALPQK